VRSCPAGSEAIVIRMDDEDDDNRNDRGGSIGSIISTNNTEFLFCRVDGQKFRPYSVPGGFGPYAVLKLGAICPNGSSEFTRRFDNEDDDNNNFSAGNIFPNVSDSNTTLRFCLFTTGSPVQFIFPSLGFNYHVFGNLTGPGAPGPTGFVRTDDEDDSNNNQYSVNSAVASVATSVVSAGPNTTLRVMGAR
jgi:hypothetical protein